MSYSISSHHPVVTRKDNIDGSGSNYSQSIYTYDYANRLTQTVYDGSLSESKAYLANGLLSHETDRNGSNTYFDYDGLNRLIGKWSQVNSTEYSYTETGYDKTGLKTYEKTSLILTSANVVPQSNGYAQISYEYNDAGKVTRTEVSDGAITEFDYDDAYNVTEKREYYATDNSSFENLITNPSFENGSTGWNLGGGTITTGGLDGTYKLDKTNANTEQTFSNNTFVNNHIYYMSVYGKASSGSSGMALILEKTGWSGEMFSDGGTVTANWTKVSARGMVDTSQLGNSPFLVIWSSTACSIDKVMMVDLTAMFGAGNEPTKEWCDACIPFEQILETGYIKTNYAYDFRGIAPYCPK